MIHPDDMKVMTNTLGELKSNWLRLALTLAYTLGKKRALTELEERDETP